MTHAEEFTQVITKIQTTLLFTLTAAKSEINCNGVFPRSDFRLTQNTAETFVSPFVNVQFSSLKQNSYSEIGAGIFNQHVKSNRNSYFAGQSGVEFKRVFRHGNYSARLGIKHAFTHIYKLKSNQDKTHFMLTLAVENGFIAAVLFLAQSRNSEFFILIT